MIYRYGDFDIAGYLKKIPVQKRRRGNQKSRTTNYSYKDLICAFDIETSLINTTEMAAGLTGAEDHGYQAVMYIWQFQAGSEITIYGRYWDEFMALMFDIADALKDERVVIFVHNLSYEFQFLRDPKLLGSYLNEESVFCVKPRTPIKFTCFDDKIEFRCSYLQTNMSLAEFTDKMQVQHGKLSGDEFDYSKIRYSWTSLTDRELEYCFNDVIGLVEALQKECELDHDNLYTLPLTSTGYVRRDVKRAIQKLPHGYIGKQLPDYHTYRLLREAFRGGNTHASRFYAGHRIDLPVICRDFSSSYPNVMLNMRYPITPFREITSDHQEVDDIIQLVKKGRAVICRIAMYDIKLIYEFWPVPYLSRDKCRNILNPEYDNGRIISADYLETTVTDVDLQILLEEYDARIEVLEAEFASYGYLPEEIKAVIRGYFTDKTRLKGVDDQKIYYDKAKALLNSIYGMTAQNPVKLEDCYSGGDYVTGIHYHDEEGMKQFLTWDDAELQALDIYRIAHGENIEKSTMPYQWGVWVTSWARYNLEQAIKLCGDQFIYCDTDSVYYWGEVDFTAYNKAAMQLSRKSRAFADDPKGKRHYMGVMELDKEVDSFKTMGAKKYAYMKDGELHITIAGVSKSKGAEELTAYAADNSLRDGLDAMQENFTFSDAGGTESIYNDHPIELLELDGHAVYVPTNVAIKPSSYKIGLGWDYRELIKLLSDNDLWDLYRKNLAGAQLPSIPC